jgi:DNA-binding transcriptional regulator YdaS (Cro superfamily)
MQVQSIIAALGGRQAVMDLTGINSPAFSQMKSRGRIPDHHVRYFIAVNPHLDWENLLESDYQRFSEHIAKRKRGRKRA